jgi:hypothetical protein
MQHLRFTVTEGRLSAVCRLMFLVHVCKETCRTKEYLEAAAASALTQFWQLLRRIVTLEGLQVQ